MLLRFFLFQMRELQVPIHLPNLRGRLRRCGGRGFRCGGDRGVRYGGGIGFRLGGSIGFRCGGGRGVRLSGGIGFRLSGGRGVRYGGGIGFRLGGGRGLRLGGGRRFRFGGGIGFRYGGGRGVRLGGSIGFRFGGGIGFRLSGGIGFRFGGGRGFRLGGSIGARCGGGRGVRFGGGRRVRYGGGIGFRLSGGRRCDLQQVGGGGHRGGRHAQHAIGRRRVGRINRHGIAGDRHACGQGQVHGQGKQSGGRVKAHPLRLLQRSGIHRINRAVHLHRKHAGQRIARLRGQAQLVGSHRLYAKMRSRRPRSLRLQPCLRRLHGQGKAAHCAAPHISAPGAMHCSRADHQRQERDAQAFAAGLSGSLHGPALLNQSAPHPRKRLHAAPWAGSGPCRRPPERRGCANAYSRFPPGIRQHCGKHSCCR